MSLPLNGYTQKRQHWMGVLAKSSLEEIEEVWQLVSEKPDYRFLRRPETGTIMVRARAGGSGLRFNLGEMTVTRCTVETKGGCVGCAYIMGRDHRHAELAALVDAMLQEEAHQSKVLSKLISKLEASSEKRKNEISRKSAATKVDFFTMVRGE